MNMRRKLKNLGAAVLHILQSQIFQFSEADSQLSLSQ